jgi:hypothetical protein
MDENEILRLIVGVLTSHPSEWLTFSRVSAILGKSGIDSDIVAALVEFRPDLFAVTRDRRFKLRSSAHESITLVGISRWQLPPRRQPQNEPVFREGMHAEIPSGGCYCNVGDVSVLKDLINGSVPDAALVYRCCWVHICRVRGLNFRAVDDETWREICQRRGYLRERENPRGF